MSTKGLSREEIMVVIAEHSTEVKRLRQEVDDTIKNHICPPEAYGPVLKKVENLCARYKAIGFMEGELRLLDFEGNNIVNSNNEHNEKKHQTDSSLPKKSNEAIIESSSNHSTPTPKKRFF